MRATSPFVLAAAAASLSYAQSTISNVSSSACPTDGGVHVIVARASTEQEGYGIIGAVKDKVLDQVPGSTAEFVVYPATLDNYFNSETQGVVGMRTLIDNYVEKCSEGPLVLLGYSQGAQVVTDTLAGQDDAAFPENTTKIEGLPLDQRLPDSTMSRVAAAIVMGDPSFNTTETFHVGNATMHGLFVRSNVANFDPTGLSSRMQSYCDKGDPYCAGGNFSTISVHLHYVQEYGAQALEFIVDRVKSYAGGNSTSSNSTTTTNGTASPTGSAAPTTTTSTQTGSASTIHTSDIVLVTALGAIFALFL